jgi:hypothetical protein
VQYLIVKNAIVDPADFSYLENDPGYSEFRRTFKPQEIIMEYRLPKVEHPARQHGLTIGTVAHRAHFRRLLWCFEPRRIAGISSKNSIA